MQIIQDYRYLHTVPEPDRVLPKTAAYIERSLKPLKCRVFSPVRGAVCAFFDFGQAHTLAFRADMDALPIRENTGLPWQSRHPGLMHACGHDGHCAILLELARRIHLQSVLAHNILLIFQPAEETDGGARQLCETGLLEQYRVRCIFSLHLWPGLPKGKLFSRPGVLMGRSCAVTVRFTGKSVHIARYQRGADALTACCRFYLGANALNDRDTLLKFGMLQAGTAGNILCGSAELTGSLRTLRGHDLSQRKLMELCRSTARQTGCQGQLNFHPGYPAVENDERLLSAVQSILPVERLKTPCFTAEDFSHYQHRVPGLYCLLGIGDAPPLHSDRFCFDETVLSRGADCFYSIAAGL